MRIVCGVQKKGRYAAMSKLSIYRPLRRPILSASVLMFGLSQQCLHTALEQYQDMAWLRLAT